MDGNVSLQAVQRRHESKFLICFVGFGEVVNTLETISVVKMIEILVPEAQILEHKIFSHESPKYVQKYSETQAGLAASPLPIEVEELDFSSDNFYVESVPEAEAWTPQNSTTVISRTQHEFFSSDWIHNEALKLLRRIQEHNIQQRVLIAAYGFGGLIVKEAMIIANTNPCFYNIAINVESIVFSAVPDPSVTPYALEQQLLDTLHATKRQYRGPLWQILRELVNSATQITYEFYRFAGKYRITRWIEEGSNVLQAADGSQKILLWSQQGEEGLLRASVNDLKQLELLRNTFAPRHLLAPLLSDETRHSGGNYLNNGYFEALRSLSQSRWILWESQTLDDLEYFNCLHATHRSTLSNFSFTQFTGGSIQVIGPQGCGKSAFAKFLYQKIIQESSLVSIASTVYPQQLNQDPCWVYMDCIRQIFSQKPALFIPVQGLYAEILHHNIWSENVLKLLLTSIFHHSDGTDFLMIIHNFDSLSKSMRSWWMWVKNLFASIPNSNCTFLTTSCQPLDDFPTSRAFQFDLGEKHKDSMSSLIALRARQFVNNGRFSSSNNKTLRSTVENQLLCSNILMKSSISMVTPSLNFCFQRFTIYTSNSIEEEIGKMRPTQFNIFAENIQTLKTQPRAVLLWTSAALSWILQARRPLRLEELSAAIAVDLCDSNIQSLRRNMSLDIEQNLKYYLSGFIVVEQKSIFFINSEARKYLSVDNEEVTKILHFQAEEELVKIALHYITIVLKSELRHSTDICLSGGSEYHAHADPDPILGFMDYACRFWHLHFQNIEAPGDDITDIVIKFLNKKQIANKWFDIFLRNNGLAHCLLGRDTIVTTATRGYEEEKENNLPLEYSPLQIACYFGFTSLLPILGKDDLSQGLQMFRVRHGRSEHDVVVLQSQAMHYLSTSSLVRDEEFLQFVLHADTKMISGYFPLHRAAVLGLSEGFKELFHQKGDLPKIDKEGRTPLHMAAICGSLDIISFIISEAESQARCEILDILDNGNETALITATRLGNFQAAQLLVQAGTDIAIQNTLGKTAVHYAVLNCPQVLGILAQRSPHVLSVQDSSGHTALHLAARIGSIKSVSLITYFAPTSQHLSDLLEATDDDEKTALQHAAEHGYDQIATYLIKKGKLTESQEIGKMAYIYAAKCGHLSTLKAITTDDLQIGPELLVEASEAGQLLVVHYLFQKGISPTQIVDDRRPAICGAAFNGFTEIVRTLLRNGADINAKDADRRTALHHAAENGVSDVIDTLLNPQDWMSSPKQRANVNAVDSLRYTPLHLAAKSGRDEVVKLLMRFNPDLSARSRQGETPLHLATLSPRIMNILLISGADVNATDLSDQTPLHIAAQTGCLETVRLLMRNEADTEVVDSNGRSPLYHAIKHQHISIMEEILDYQSKFVRVGKDPWHNLELAITQSKLEVLKYLVRRESVSVDSTDDRIRTLLHVAAGYDSHEIVSYLIEIGFEVGRLDENAQSPLHAAAESGLVDNMKVLIKIDSTQMNQADCNGDTPLHLAVKNDHLQAVSFLLDQGSDIDREGSDKRTPLFQAAYFGKLNIVKVLLDRNADPELPDKDGWCALHAAVDNLEIVELFISKQANLNVQMLDRWTPLHFSVMWGENEVAQLLLANGADPNISSDDMQTPFDLSFDKRMESIFIQHQGPIRVDLKKYDSSGYAPIHKAIIHSSPEDLAALIDIGANLQTKIKQRFTKSCLTIAVEMGKADHLSVLLDHGKFFCDDPTWDDDEVSAAYWLGISGCQVACVKMLIRHGIGLPQEIQGGLNKLEAYIDNVQTGCEMPLFVKSMMNFGFSPFKRSNYDKKSAFELHMIDTDKVNKDFLLACIAYLDKPRLSKLGFKDLRAISELDFSTVNEAFQTIRKNVTDEETDQDGWTIGHFLYQVDPRIQIDKWKDDFSKWPTELPEALILPLSWQLPNTDYAALIAIAPNTTEATFQSGWSPITLRSNCPFPPRELGQVYYEVSIHPSAKDGTLKKSVDEEPDSLPYTVAIGFCGEFCDLLQRHVGWEKWSVGYHGDDGGIFHEIGHASHTTGHTFGAGNIVGCGINYKLGEYFFTLDGVVVYSRKSDIIYRKLYPVISQRHKSCHIKVNFGNADFRWAEANAAK